MTDQVRYGLLLRTAMEVLRDHKGAMPNSAVADEVQRRIVPNSAERKLQSSGLPAWRVAMGYDTGDAATVGWLIKDPTGWRITDEGITALDEFPTPEALHAENKSRYGALRRQRKAARANFAAAIPIIADLLDDVPVGSWTSYDDLALAAGVSGRELAHLLAAEAFTNSYRVLNADGTVPELRFQHVNYRGTDLRERLAREGVEFDELGHADQDQRITGEMLLTHLAETSDEAGGEGARAWLVRGSAVSGHNVVPQWLADGFVSIAASHLRQLEPGTALDSLRSAVESDYAHLSYNQRKTKLAELHAFLNRMALGDAVVTTSEGKVYVGRVTGDAGWQPGDALTTIRRPVSWQEEGVDWSELSDTMQTRLKSAAAVIDLTDAAEAVEALFVSPTEIPTKPTVHEAPLPDLPAETVERLLVGKEWLHEVVDLLRERRQVILYGPPGTGKTFLALEVASALTDPANVTLVQFHPAYSYEDFFEGYRPTTVDDAGKIGFALTPGPFRKIVDQARENPGQPYILIVDEINRANLAKVFGELYFLLEYRDRSIDLMYASGDQGRDFSLPKNVYVIGTMNTADRSIALVDAAMRRRFAFLSLHPDDAHMTNLLRDWLERNDLPTLAADLLVELNRRIPDEDFKIGPSYLMCPEVATNEGLGRIWRTQIIPLLQEFHFGDSGINVIRQYGLDSLLAAVTPTSEALPTDATEQQSSGHDEA
jgi:5-methylcytosine-specific restriction protein B